MNSKFYLSFELRSKKIMDVSKIKIPSFKKYNIYFIVTDTELKYKAHFIFVFAYEFRAPVVFPQLFVINMECYHLLSH